MGYIRKHISQILMSVLLVVGIGISFWSFIRDNTDRIHQQNAEYIEELTTQRAISVDNLIHENLNFIQSTAYLYGKSLTSPWADVAVIRDYEENSVFDMLRFVDASGDDYTSRGVMANLADREYFKSGMRGESGITYVLSSRVTNEKQIGFYAPVSYDDEIIGIMVGFYGEAYIRDLLEYELFGETGEGWLCLEDGTVLGTTAEGEWSSFLDYLARYGTEQELNTFLEGMEERGKKAFSFTYSQGDEETAAYVVTLENAPWFLVRSFPSAASQRILDNANREGVALITEMLFLFIIYVLLLVVGHMVDARRMRQENQNANDVSTGVSRLFDKFITIDLTKGTYLYVRGQSPDPQISEEGDYGALCASLLRFVTDPAQKEELQGLIDARHLREVLADSNRISTRVHIPSENDRWYTYNFIVIDRENGLPTRILMACQNVTELHQREEEEQRRLQSALDATEKASRAKTEFLFNMSHDLRTPMNAIIGYTELAKREQVSREEMMGYIEKIDASSTHLLALINDILEMSRIESGKMTLENVPTDLHAVMADAKAMFDTQMTEKGITFTVDSSGVTDSRVMCDRNRLNRILLNLLSNALKFTPKGGEVTASLTQTASGERSEYLLRVSDSGIGMGPEFVEKLFTPFERERTSTVSGIQGTGLGLSITKNIVDLMGGNIRVETAPGERTTFLVTLPFAIDHTEPEKNAEEETVQTLDFSH
ncbi:MAG: sensor histidine kinase, partial [Clostridia bacterium]|nr:sensor histidine kinase [Clostridia bacterium]